MFSTKLFSCSVQERFEQIFSTSPPDVIDLLLKILVYDPEFRASPSAVLAHPFFDELRKDHFQVYPRGAHEPMELNLLDFTPYELDLLGPYKELFLR